MLRCEIAGVLGRRLLALPVCLALACGASHPSPPPDGTGSGGSGGGGGTGGDGGGTGTTGGGTGGDGGGSGGGSGGGAETSVAIERLDADAECDGLLPGSAPAPVTVSRSVAPGSTCVGGTSDGTGHVVVGALAGQVSSWASFSPGGAALGTFEGDGLDELVPEADGFSGARVERDAYGGIARVLHVALAGDGSLRAEGDVSGDPAQSLPGLPRIARDPLGGCAIAIGETSSFGNHWSGVTAQRFGAGGAATTARVRAGVVSGPRVDFLVAGVSTRGDALVLWRAVGGAVDRAWIARDGSLRGDAAPDDASWHADLPAMDYPSSPRNLRLEPLLDGSLALQVQGQWAWTIPDLGAHREAPGWLRSRPGTTVRFTRGNRGYAVLPPAGATAPSCDQRVEVLAPSGRLCGALTFTEPGGACTTGRIDQGWDGTVVQQSARDGCAGTSCTCTARFWPRLLASP